MSQPDYNIFPCIFCTIGFNCYVAGHKLIAATYKITKKEATELNSKVPVPVQPQAKKEMID